MCTDRITLSYQREDDILYVTFGQEGRKGTGINLHNNILLRLDSNSAEPLGLTFIDYSKLKNLSNLPLRDLSTLPKELEQMVRQLLLSEPVNRFIDTDSATFGYFSVINPSMEKVIAA
ncbi:hypothetical protein HUU05_05145 [candidate division KSB1 bacterium]|nr:hypothetical protein [candidate division KSB1 bacterium]